MLSLPIPLSPCRRLGFNDALVQDGLHRFVISLHAFNAVRLETCPFDPKVADLAVAQWLKKSGTPTGGRKGIYFVGPTLY